MNSGEIIELLMSIMREHADSAEVQQSVFQAFIAICTNHAANKVGL
jgi:hypothetical protein